MSVSDELLNDLKRLSDLGDPPPRTAMVQGRDRSSGDGFIQVGVDSGAIASAADLLADTTSACQPSR